MGRLKYRRRSVCIDGNDRLAVADTGHVLQGTRDTERDVQPWLYRNTGLTDLAAPRDKPDVHHWPRGAKRSTELAGDVFKYRDVLLRPNTPSDGEN